MTEETQVDESGGEDFEAEAREMHWVPKEEYRGDPKDWVSAQEFVERGRQIMPILRENNKRLIEEQRSMRETVRQLAAKLEAAQGDFDTLQEFHNEEVSRRVEETRKELLSQLKVAKREGDVDTEVELQGQLSKLDAANTAVEEEIEEAGGKKPDAPQLTPDYLEWKSANDWFETDAERTYEAMAQATRLTKERPELRGKLFFAELDKRLHGKTSRPGNGKVEGSRGGASNTGGNGRTYADLDKDARAQCDKYAKKFVKKDGKFKTVDEYRKHYVAELENTGYFQ